MPAPLELPVLSHLDTYEQAASFKTNLVWKQLDETSVEEALSHWLPTLSQKTQLNYRSGIKKLI